jgi:hypothetical protein
MENNIIITTEEFLTDIYGSLDVPIYFNVDRNTWKNKPQSYLVAKKTLLWRNSLGEDIYYIVNSGGSADDQIDVFRAAFIDWDCGKDKNKNYFPIEIVDIKKQEFLTNLSNSPLKSSYIIETRNGYHLYWILTDNPSRELYIDIQKRLSYYFHSDPTIINPARVMRLPNYYWRKSSHCLDPFFVTIVDKSGQSFTTASLHSSFPEVSDSDFETYRSGVRAKSCSAGKRDYAPIKRTQESVLENQRKSAQDNYYDIIGYTRSIYLGTLSQFSSEPVIVDSYEKVIEYIKKQNIAEYLNKCKKISLKESDYKDKNKIYICCPFHNDSTPSGSIYRRDEDGYYYYKCHSDVCGYGPGTIIDVVQKIHRLSRYDAVKLLIERFNIIIDDKWKTEYKEVLEQNIKIIENIGQYKDKYPNLYRYIHRIKGDLISKLRFAQEHVALKSVAGEPMFICSLLEFEKLKTKGMANDIGRQNERIDRYCLLGLMRKLPDNEITSGILCNAYENRKKIQKTHNIKNMSRTQIYSFTEYTEGLLVEADKTAALIKSHGVRMNSISYDLISDVFGANTAKTIYPQKNIKGMSISGKQFQGQVESILLEELSTRGYSKVIDIVNHLKAKYNWGKVTDRRVKKYIPGLLIKHGLEEVYCDEELKEKLYIQCQGYPRIIIRRELLKQEKEVVG